MSDRRRPKNNSTARRPHSFKQDFRCPQGQHWVEGHWRNNHAGYGRHWVEGHCADDPSKMSTTRIEKTTRYGWDRGPVYIKEKRTTEEREGRGV